VLVVNGQRCLDHAGPEPSWIDSDGANGVAEDVTESAALGRLLPVVIALRG
jgi:hypothetical protein